MPELLINKVIDQVVSKKYDNLSSQLVTLAKYAIADTIGVALAGWHEPAPSIVKEIYASGSREGGSSSLWGENSKVKPEIAALVNGTAGHALDYDDFIPEIRTHTSVSLVAGIIPLAESLGSSGKDVICAYAAGSDAMIAVGLEMGFRHFQLGWHPTSTLGTIGVAAACARLMHLDVKETAYALGIAGSMASGIQKNFGTMTKPLHAGLAASNGIRAAVLASKGFTASENVFGDGGFLNVFEGLITRSDNPNLFERPISLEEIGISTKKFPCCYLTHRLIQGALNLREQYSLNLERISKVVCVTPPWGLRALIYHRPRTGLQAKFSAEYTVLSAIADGKVDLTTFEDSSVQRPEIQAKLHLVDVREQEGEVINSEELDTKPIEIQVTTTDGQILKTTVQNVPGSKELPLTEEERRAKWSDCISHFAKVYGGIKGMGIEPDSMFKSALALDSYDNVGDWLQAVLPWHQAGSTMEEYTGYSGRKGSP